MTQHYFVSQIAYLNEIKPYEMGSNFWCFLKAAASQWNEKRLVVHHKQHKKNEEARGLTSQCWDGQIWVVMTQLNV